MVGHGVEYMPHQRCVPSRNPKVVLARIFCQISDRRYSFIGGSSEIPKVRLRISISIIKRDRV